MFMMPVFRVVMQQAGLLIFDVSTEEANLIFKCQGALEEFIFYLYKGLINKNLLEVKAAGA
jgi:hypothetical protein